MGKKNIFDEEGSDVKDILIRFKRRDFRGNTGKAVKNSFFSFSSTLVSKVGSLIFTVVLARLLLPELFGLYSLALSTIVIFLALSDLGISGTLVKFIASSKRPEKSKAYFLYLLKIKVMLFFVSAILLVSLAKVIAHSYYGKPIFLALIAGSLYIFFLGFISFIEGVFHALNNFKKGFYKEIIFQCSRLIFVPLVILWSLSRFSIEILISLVFVGLSISFFFAFIYIYVSAKKEFSFLRLKAERLKKLEKIKINKFIMALSAMTVSAVLFGYIDMIVLGRFVEGEFIGYYRAAFSLIGSVAPLISFSGALFPLFSRLKGKQLKRGLKKSVRLTIFIAILVVILTFVLAPLLVRIVFGAEYSSSTNILRMFSVLILILPLIAIYSSFLVSQNKPKIVAQSLVISIIINIVLNLILIIYLLRYGYLAAVYGATVATIISKIFYLGMLVKSR